MNIERRFFKAELRADDTAGPKIGGLAARYNVPSEDLGGFREIISPGAFTASLATNPDVVALYQHDPSDILGRTRSGSLRLRETDQGLAFECDLPDTQLGRDVFSLVKRGDLSECSFAFTTDAEDYSAKDGQRVRELQAVSLHDVSVVTFPAYPDTSVAVRSMQNWEKQHRFGLAMCQAKQRLLEVTCNYRASDDRGIPSDPPGGNGTAVAGAWTKPTLADFTDKSWSALTTAERRRISCYYAFRFSLDTFGDLKLPHHFPNSGKPSIDGIRNALSRLGQVKGMTASERKTVQAHLESHMPHESKALPATFTSSTQEHQEVTWRVTTQN
jgi:uncharacterized protein